MHRYSVDIFFTYSGPSGILSSDGKQNTTLAGARGVRIVVFLLILMNRVCCFLILYVLSISEGSVLPDYLQSLTPPVSGLRCIVFNKDSVQIQKTIVIVLPTPIFGLSSMCFLNMLRVHTF